MKDNIIALLGALLIPVLYVITQYIDPLLIVVCLAKVLIFVIGPLALLVTIKGLLK